MTDPDDDEALQWVGDEDRLGPTGPAPRLLAPAGDGTTDDARAGGAGLVVLGLLGGVAVLETVGWVRGVFTGALATTLDTGSGSTGEVVVFAVNLAGRVLAVLAPLVWFGAAVWRVRAPSRRTAWLLLGAVLLVPWPALLVLA